MPPSGQPSPRPERTITIGGNRSPEACTHAELVAVFDTHSGEIRRWTGKSYPVDGQQHTLDHVKDLGTHFLELGSERLLLLGCHDLLLFAARGRPSVHGPTPKEERCRRMIGLAVCRT